MAARYSAKVTTFLSSPALRGAIGGTTKKVLDTPFALEFIANYQQPGYRPKSHHRNQAKTEKGEPSPTL